MPSNLTVIRPESCLLIELEMLRLTITKDQGHGNFFRLSGYHCSTEAVQFSSLFLFPFHHWSAVASDLEPVNPFAVFVNNEVDLSKVNIYGFDYDYTLATYTQALDEFIFNEARDWMVKQLKVIGHFFHIWVIKIPICSVGPRLSFLIWKQHST